MKTQSLPGKRQMRTWVQILKYKILHFHFDFRRGPKYQNIGCIDADFCADFAIFLHFSRSTRIYCRKRVKISKNAKILRTKFGNFQKMSKKKGHILILWLYFVLWYFA